ncbi:hypothetical protein Tco_1165218 [Tanacetum coccineum]
MEWLPKCAELEMAVGSQNWLGMMVVYCRNAAKEDREFATRVNSVSMEYDLLRIIVNSVTFCSKSAVVELKIWFFPLICSRLRGIDAVRRSGVKKVKDAVPEASVM